jgi:Putative addiction module component
MALTVEKVTQEALGLPVSDRALVVESLLASLAGETNPDAERAHLDEIRQRRAAVRSGKTGLVEGSEALREVRAALRK